MMDVFINLIMIIISQCVHILNYHILYPDVYNIYQFYLNKAAGKAQYLFSSYNSKLMVRKPLAMGSQQDTIFC